MTMFAVRCLLWLDGADRNDEDAKLSVAPEMAVDRAYGTN